MVTLQVGIYNIENPNTFHDDLESREAVEDVEVSEETCRGDKGSRLYRARSL